MGRHNPDRSPKRIIQSYILVGMCHFGSDPCEFLPYRAKNVYFFDIICTFLLKTWVYF